MKRSFLLFFLVILILSSNAQSDWVVLNPKPTINSLRGDYFISEQEGWAVGTGGTILHTTDGGYSWDTQHNNENESLSSVFFIDDTEGWTVGWSSIYHTTNAGETWEKQVKPSWPGDLYDVSFINPDTGWIVGAYKIIFKTTNGGENWHRIMSDSHQDFWFFSVDFADELHGCAVGGEFGGNHTGIVMITDDGGENWTEVTPSGTKYFNKVNFTNDSTVWICGSDGGLFQSVDRGNTWIDRGFTNNEEYMDIHFFDDLRGVLLTRYKARITEDGGETWDSVSTINNNNSVGAFSSGNDNHLVAVGYAGFITRSVDGGTTWEQLSQNQNLGSIGQIGFFNSSDGLAVTGYYNSVGLVRTSDGGNTWTDDTIIPNGPFYKMQITGQKGFFLNNSYQLIKTNDAGETWTQYDVPPLTTYYYDMQFLNEQTGYLCGDSSLLIKTTDGGLNWEQISFDQNYRFSSMYFFNENKGWLIDMNNKYILRTEDGGENWSEILLTEDGYIFTPKCINFIDEETGFLSTAEGVLYKTTDGGDNWQQDYVFPGGGNSKIHFVSEDEGWYFTTYQVYHTFDGGETWVNPQSFNYSTIRSFFFLDDGQGWLCGFFGLIAWHSSWVGIHNTQENNTVLKITPNPASHFVHVDLMNSKERIEEVTVYNMMGQQIVRYDDLHKTGSFQMDISKLSRGTYILNVSSAGRNRLGKFIIQ